MVTSTCDLKKGSAMNVKKRDVEKTYPLPEFITKLRRLADALESEHRSTSRWQVSACGFRPALVTT
jgi:hypothetical protein